MVDSLLNRVASQLFKVESGEQVIFCLRVLKQNRRNGRDSESRILCLTVKRKEKGNSVRLFALKENEKGGSDGAFSIIKKYKVKKLKRVEGLGKNEFILYFEAMRPLNVRVEQMDQRNSFLYKLVQVCRESFHTAPKLVGINLTELSNYAVDQEDITEQEESDENDFDEDLTDMDQKDLVTEEEEKTLIKVLKQFGLDISDAKSVVNQLNQKLADTEEENIHAILENQNEWKEVVNQIRVTKEKINEINTWLGNYYKELMTMQKDIEQIEAENNDMEIQARNHQKLSEELRKFVDKLYFDEKHENSLKNESFETDAGLKKIVDAIKVLEEALEGKMQDGMENMAAFVERTKYFKQLRALFVNRLKIYLKKKFEKIAEQHLKDIKTNLKKSKSQATQDQLIELPLHGPIYKELQKFQPLMKSVLFDDKDVATGSLLQLQQSYSTAMQLPYRRELQEYFQDIKHSIKRNKESKANSTFLLVTKETSAQISRSTISQGNKQTSTSLTAKNTSSQMTTADDDEDSDNDETTQSQISSSIGISVDMRADVGFARCLTDICDIIYDEQQFCTKFFHLDASQELQGNSDLQKMLEVMFKFVNGNFKNLMDSIERRVDKFYTLPMLLLTEQKFNSYQGKSAFLRFLLADVLALINGVLNRFTDKQVEAVNEYKCIVKKTTIVPFVAKFPYFIDKFDSLTGNFSDRHQTETLYLKVLKAIFGAIDNLAETDPKHANAFKLKNYTFIFKTLSNRNLESKDLQRYISNASEIYKTCRDNYIMWIIKGKFADLFEFFEGVDECLKTMEVEDISYQSQFSKSRLKELITKKHPTFAKDVSSLVKRMDKHIGIDRSATAVKTNYNLYLEVWNYLRDTFISRYTRMEELVKKCYTNISLEPTIAELKVMFEQATENNKNRLTM